MQHRCATLLGDQGCFGVGMCPRNSQDYFIKALIKWYDGVPPPLSKCIGFKGCYFMAWSIGLIKNAY